jgi:regulator of protease activity HflC (stomatin/prohibitin superfamily)
MAIAIILGIVLFILAVVAGVLAGYFFSDERTGGGIASVIACVSLALSFLCVPFSIRTVDAGEIAVVKEMGKIIDTREAGTHFDFWMVRSYDKYDTKVRQLDITTQSYSNDKQTMDVAMTVQYQVKPDAVKEIAKTYGGLTALEGKIQSIAVERTKAVLSSYTADKIIMERATVSSAVSTEIENTVGDNYHVDITMVALTNIDFSDAYEQAVEAKMVAEQAKLQKDYENQAKEAAAKTEAEVKKLQADADAYTKEKAAEAEAKAIEIKSLEVARMLGLTVVDAEGNEVIKPELKDAEAKLIADYLKYMEYLATWDGKLPEVMTDGNMSLILPND